MKTIIKTTFFHVKTSYKNYLFKTIFLLLLIMVSAPTKLHAQEMTTSLPFQKFSLTSVEQGLLQRTVVTMLPDKHGLMGFGVLDGFNKHAAYHVIVKIKDDPPWWKTGWVYVLTEIMLIVMVASIAYYVNNHRAKKLRTALHTVNELGHELASNTHLQPDEVISLIYGHISQVLDTNNMYIAFYDMEQQYLNFALIIHRGQRAQLPALSVETENKDKEQLVKEVIQSGQPVCLSNVEAWYKVRNLETLNKLLPKSWLGVPLITEGKLLGLIVLQCYYTEGAYGQDDLEILQIIAAQVADSLENSQVVQQQKQPIQNVAIVKKVLAEPVLNAVNGREQKMKVMVRKELRAIFRYTAFQRDTILANSELFSLKVVQQKLTVFIQERSLTESLLSRRDKADILRCFLSLHVKKLCPNPEGTPSKPLSREWNEYLILMRYVEGKRRKVIEDDLFDLGLPTGGSYGRHMRKARHRLATLILQAEMQIKARDS